GGVWRRRIHRRPLSHANAWYPDSRKWNRTIEAWPDAGAGSGAAHCHGCPITPRLSRRLPAAGAMDHRDSTIARNVGGECSTHAAGVAGRGDSDRLHRLVEHCQSPLGARFGPTTRDGGAASAGSEPRPHGPPDADRVHAAVAHRRCRGSRNRSGYFGFHPALRAIECSPAQRSTNRLGGAGVCSTDFHFYRLSVWAFFSALFGENGSLL